jgi:hypothetical protein
MMKMMTWETLDWVLLQTVAPALKRFPDTRWENNKRVRHLLELESMKKRKELQVLTR